VVDCGADFRADPEALAAACSGRTMALVGSAPSFPQGVIDPIEALAEIAGARGLGLHVDASLGGFFLPFAERLGRAVLPWDFRVPGVTSMSADLHKFGYAAKGASVVLYRDATLRRHQFFATDQWSGGIFASPGVLGTRPGGAIAAAWAAIHALGENGYRRLASDALETSERLQDGIRRLGLRVLGDPAISVFAFGSVDDTPIQVIADGMEARGWHLDRLQRPDSIHCIITAAHREIVKPFLDDLAASVAEARRDDGARPVATEPAVLYGVTGDIAAGGDPIASAIAGLGRRWEPATRDE
jgi:glutamate/tyrosine decarboxylase-like PLP-dependent enzyme